MVLGIIAMLGLVLAAVGISGVTYRGVIDRTEGIRGAARAGIRTGGGGSASCSPSRSAISRSARSRASRGGIALGGLLAHSLENVGRVDAITTGASIAVIGTVGIAAALLPALRVMRVEPAEVLRH